MPHRRAGMYVKENAAILALILSAAANTILVVTIVVLNTHRITDIQRSRLESCRSTYTAFHLVFDPFVKPLATRSAKDQRRIDRFNRTIDRLRAGCVAQTHVSLKNEPR